MRGRGVWNRSSLDSIGIPEGERTGPAHVGTVDGASREPPTPRHSGPIVRSKGHQLAASGAFVSTETTASPSDTDVDRRAVRKSTQTRLTEQPPNTRGVVPEGCPPSIRSLWKLPFTPSTREQTSQRPRTHPESYPGSQEPRAEAGFWSSGELLKAPAASRLTASLRSQESPSWASRSDAQAQSEGGRPTT